MTGIGPRRYALPAAALAIFCGSTGAAALKLLTDTPAGQAIAERSAVAGAVLLAWSLAKGGGRFGPMGRMAWLRAMLDAVAALTFALAVFELPLALLTSINMLVPVVAMLLGVVMLGETVSRLQVAAVIAGLAGVLIVVQPSVSVAPAGIVLAVISTLAYALRDAANRRLPPRSSGAQTALVSVLLAGSAGAILGGVTGWIVPPPMDIMAVALTGICYVASSMLIISALRSAPLTVVSTLRYSSIFWAILFDFLIDGRQPGFSTLIGVTLVVISGLMLLRPASRKTPS